MKRPPPNAVPCPNGCGADAWDVDPDGRLHFTACRYGMPVEGARPLMGFIYGVWCAIKRALPKGSVTE